MHLSRESSQKGTYDRATWCRRPVGRAMLLLPARCRQHAEVPGPFKFFHGLELATSGHGLSSTTFRRVQDSLTARPAKIPKCSYDFKTHVRSSRNTAANFSCTLLAGIYDCDM